MPKSQKPIVCINGSRSIKDINLDGWLNPQEIGCICAGGANGVDYLAEMWAKRHKIEFVAFPAQWDIYGKKAGFMRNEDMINFSDKLISFWDGVSHGTKYTIDYALSLGRQVEIHLIKDLCNE